MGKKRRKLLSKKYSKIPWNIHNKSNNPEIQTEDILEEIDTPPLKKMKKILKKDLLEMAEQLTCDVTMDNTKKQIIEAIQNKRK
jgi:uncharacterized protein YaaW (UPF0174 family)